jgi:hypothetical protein
VLSISSLLVGVGVEIRFMAAAGALGGLELVQGIQ